MSILISSAQRIVEEMNRESARDLKHVVDRVIRDEGLSRAKSQAIVRAALENVFFEEYGVIRTNVGLISDKQFINFVRKLMTSDAMSQLEMMGDSAKAKLDEKHRLAEEEKKKKRGY